MMLEFKPYSNPDHSDVLEMMAEFYAIDGYDFDLQMARKNVEEFTSDTSFGRLYLIRYSNLNVGYIVLTFGYSFEYKGRDAFIDEFFIKQDHRNKGFGKRALDFVESESKKLNIKEIHLEVEPHNTNANKLYAYKGYRSNNRKLMTKLLY